MDLLQEKTLENKIRGCLFGLAIADAAVYGPAAGTPAGGLSPQADLVLLVGETLSQAPLGAALPPLLSKAFLAWSEKGRQGGQAFDAALAHLKQGGKWQESGSQALDPGAALRATTVGLLENGATLDHMQETVIQSTQLIQTDTLALAGGLAQAFASAYLARVEELDALHFMESLITTVESVSAAFADDLRSLVGYLGMDCAWVIQVVEPSQGVMESFETALFCFLKSPEEFEVTLQNALQAKATAPLVALLAASLSGAYLGYDRLPGILLGRALEKARVDSAAAAILQKSLKNTGLFSASSH